MAAVRRLRLVEGTRWQEDDSVFFHRRQVRVGARLVYWGRIDHGRLFRVVEVRSQHPDGPVGRLEKVQVARHLSDTVVLETATRPYGMRRASVGALSYSAVWRLVS